MPAPLARWLVALECSSCGRHFSVLLELGYSESFDAIVRDVVDSDVRCPWAYCEEPNDPQPLHIEPTDLTTFAPAEQ